VKGHTARRASWAAGQVPGVGATAGAHPDEQKGLGMRQLRWAWLYSGGYPLGNERLLGTCGISNEEEKEQVERGRMDSWTFSASFDRGRGRWRGQEEEEAAADDHPLHGAEDVGVQAAGVEVHNCAAQPAPQPPAQVAAGRPSGPRFGGKVAPN